jgi:hypothetical protein
MEDYLNEKALARLPGRKYAQGEASEKISDAPEAFREEVEAMDGSGKEVTSHPKSRTQVLQAQRAVRGHCAVTKAEKGKGDGRKALAHNSAVTMVVYGFGEQDIQVVRAILAAKGYFTPNMRDSGYGSDASGPSKVSPG